MTKKNRHTRDCELTPTSWVKRNPERASQIDQVVSNSLVLGQASRKLARLASEEDLASLLALVRSARLAEE